MKRNTKIIQINGFRGLIMAMFVVTCLIAGFIIFPGFVAMNIWNHFAISIPQLNLYQGILLWTIVALVGFIINKQNFSISFANPKELNEEEMNILMERIKLQSQAKMLNKMMVENLEELKKEGLSNGIETVDTIETTETIGVIETTEKFEANDIHNSSEN